MLCEEGDSMTVYSPEQETGPQSVRVVGSLLRRPSQPVARLCDNRFLPPSYFSRVITPGTSDLPLSPLPGLFAHNRMAGVHNQTTWLLAFRRASVLLTAPQFCCFFSLQKGSGPSVHPKVKKLSTVPPCHPRPTFLACCFSCARSIINSSFYLSVGWGE